jgi:hypothetical protein
MKKLLIGLTLLASMNSYGASQCNSGTVAICSTDAGEIVLTDTGLIGHNEVGSPRCILQVVLPNHENSIAVVGTISLAEQEVIIEGSRHPVIMIKYAKDRNFLDYRDREANERYQQTDITCNFD